MPIIKIYWHSNNKTGFLEAIDLLPNQLFYIVPLVRKKQRVTSKIITLRVLWELLTTRRAMEQSVGRMARFHVILLMVAVTHQHT